MYNATKKEKPKITKMASDLTPEQIEEYKASFDMFDADGSGSISAEELVSVFLFLVVCCFFVFIFNLSLFF